MSTPSSSSIGTSSPRTSWLDGTPTGSSISFTSLTSVLPKNTSTRRRRSTSRSVSTKVWRERRAIWAFTPTSAEVGTFWHTTATSVAMSLPKHSTSFYCLYFGWLFGYWITLKVVVKVWWYFGNGKSLRQETNDQISGMIFFPVPAIFLK